MGQVVKIAALMPRAGEREAVVVLVREDGWGGYFVEHAGVCLRIVRLHADRLDGYRICGMGCGPFETAVAMGFKHGKSFAERVVGYTVSEEGIGKAMGDALGAGHPLLEKQPEMRLTFTFYEKA